MKKKAPSKLVSKVPIQDAPKIVSQVQISKPQPPKLSNANQQMQQNLQVTNAQIPTRNSLNSNSTPQQNMMNFPPPQFQIPQNSQQQVISGGLYGRRSIQKPYQQIPQIFNDDEQIMEKVKQEKQDAKIQIQIKAQRSMAKLKEQVILPAMCSLKTSGGARSSVDLICVIDVSGSMSGQKIELVRSTMKYVLQALTPSDRVSIITFQSTGSRVCGLKCVTQQNMVAFNTYINERLVSGGGTNINSGLNLALKTMRERKHENKVTSIFLLSDGQDRGAQQTFKQTLASKQNEGLGIFTIHSFGFGTDHDQDLMTKLCQIKDGSFYFIKQLATLDEAFCNALGGIISLVATDVVIKLSNIAKNIVEGIRIRKIYGDMWQKINDRQYKIKILQLMSGISKDYVFEIEIPKINTQVGDLDRNHDILEAIFTAKGVNNDKMSGECCFKLTLLNENQEIPQINENVDVIENHLRVMASDVIEENMKKAQQQKYQQAQLGIDKMIQVIQSSKKARPEKMVHLVSDLQNIKQKCSKQDYEVEGKKWMKSAKMAHQQQKNFAYSNKIQSDMVMMQKAKKSKF